MKKVFFTLGLICLSAIYIVAQESIWEQTAKNNNLPAFFGAASVEGVRSATIGYLGDQKAYFVVAYNNAPATLSSSSINVLNALNGSLITTLSLPDESLLAEGHFPVNTLGFTEDSVLFVASMAGAADNGKKFNVYMYKSLSDAPKLMLSTNPYPLRLGDEMVVKGKYKDGSAKIYAPNFTYAGISGKEQVRVFSLAADTQNAGEYLFANDSVVMEIDVPERGSVAGNYYSSPMYIPLENGAYLWKYLSDSLYYQSGDGNVKVKFPMPEHLTNNRNQIYILNNPVYMGMLHDRHYIAFLNPYHGRGEIYSFVTPTVDNAKWVGLRREYVTPTNMSGTVDNSTTPAPLPVNGNYTGEVAVDWSGDKPILYVLSTNQGIGAYAVPNISKSSPAPEPLPEGVNVLWERVRREGNMYVHFGTGSSTSRWMAYGKVEGIPYLFYNSMFDHDWSTTNLGTYVVDVATGQEIKQLKKPEGVVRSTTDPAVNTEGTWQFASVGVSEDGKILVTTRADSCGREVATWDPKNPHFNIYKYDGIDSEAAIVYSTSIENNVSLGNKMLVTGSYIDNTLKLYVPNLFFTNDYTPQQQEIYVFSLENIPGSGAEITCEKQMIECGGNRKVGDMTWWSPGASATKDFGEYTSSLYVPLKDGSHFWMDSYDGLYYKPVGGAGFRVNGIPSATNVPRYMGKGRDGKHYLAYFDYMPGRAVIVSYTDLAEGVDVVATTPPLYIDGYNYPLNTSGAGDIAVNWEGEHPVVYVLSSALGIGAYEITSIGAKDTDIKQPVVADRVFNSVQNGSYLMINGSETVASVEIINTLGQRVMLVTGKSQVLVSGLKGVYIVKIKGVSGTEEAKKILIR
ncbi:MAG: T9SS type A sorting domain-containing protein [Dysgonamonadaceae bacterium]|jgi:hypothetical protein|nr:T9SS type A sorting domain-containing protein [Dysgonamonadaceae bacterium]